MIKRTVEISQQPVHIAVKNAQLVILGRESHKTPLASIPCEDLGFLVVDEPGATYSHAALGALLQHDAVLVVCGRNHLPAGLLLPFANHTEVVWRVSDQIKAGKALRKKLWTQLVRAKVRAQAKNLNDGPVPSRLLALARTVRSGDPNNIEAQAAKLYWSVWLDGLPFRRDTDGDGINALLNYAYAILRAAVARALVCSGLLPVLGIHHANRSNAFCLADDLMEPLRPLADRRVRELVRAGCREITAETKRPLLALLADDVRTGDETGPLMVALSRLTASLARCFEGAADRLVIPEHLSSVGEMTDQ